MTPESVPHRDKPVFAYECTGHPKWKYRLVLPYAFQTKIRGYRADAPPWVKLDADGILHLSRGYQWDGASGPGVDTMDFARSSAGHDGLYQLFRLNKLPLRLRKKADQFMLRISREDHMPEWRAWYTYTAVRTFAAPYARPWGPRG